MPPPGHHHSSSASGQYEYSGNQPGGVNEAYQPSLKLGLGGTLSNTARMASSGNVVPSNDLYTPTGMCVQHDPQDIDSSADAGSIVQNSEPSSAMAHGNLPAYETPRKAHGFNRQPEELHIPSSYSAMGQQQPRGLPQHNSYNSSQEYPRERYGPAADEHGQAKSALPGALQPGNSERPLPSSVNTAPSSVPILAQLQTQSYATPSRSTNASQSHNYSRSSPAGMDQQKYTPYVKTPEESKFSSPPNHKYTSSQASQGGASYSPLGLADIRPRADSGMSDGPVSGNPYSYDGHPSNPTNCNYLAPWAVYAFDWCKWPVQQHGLGDAAGKMAIGSYLEDGHNFVSLLGIGQNPVSTALLTIAQIQVLETQIVPEPDPEPTSSAPKYGIEYTKTAEATHSYPVTRIVWEPASSQKQSTDLLATSGDHLRLWSMPQQAPNYVGNSITRTSNSKESIAQKLTPLALLSNSKSPEHTAPLTSLDWNTLSPSLIITSSIDTTCTIWDIPSLTAKTQLIAHDKEVFDVRFCANSVDVFVSCGADGSVRMFDLRSLEHSTIIYEPSEKGDKSASPGGMSPTTAQQTMSYAPPLLRLAASPHDTHLLATFSQDSDVIRILDVRQPGQALLELRGHNASINCIEWSPSRRGTLASGGDDSLVLLWDLINQSNTAPIVGSNGSQPGQSSSNPDSSRGPSASWQCDYEVGNISWAPQSGLTSQGSDWLGVSGGRGVWGVCI